MRLKWLPLIGIIPLTLSCASCTASPWRPYTFNGNDFQPAVPVTDQTLWLRNGYLPRLDDPGRLAADTGRLPPGTGAVAGICYLQTSGGKVEGKSSVTPYPDEQITIKSKKEGISVIRTDDAGYFIELLPPGDYQFICRGAGKQVTVKKGKTTLIQLRGGKRMAD